MATSKVEVEWRKNELLALCCSTDLAFNERLKKRFDLLIAAARAEGAEQERERIRNSAIITEVALDKHYEAGYFVPASVLAPATKEKP